MNATDRIDTLPPIDTDELSELSRAEGWDLAYIQLDAGRFSGEFDASALHRIGLHWERYGRRVQLLGTIRPGVVPVALILSAAGHGHFQGVPFEAGDLLYMRPGSECDLIAPKDLDYVILHVPAELMARTAEAWDPDSAAAVPSAAPVTRLAVADWRWLSRTLLRAFDRAAGCPIAQEELQSRTLSLLWRSLHRSGPVPTSGRVPRQERLHYARLAREQLEVNLTGPIAMESLAAEIGVSPRMLQLSFCEAFQMSPVAYLRARRLNAVRTLLKTSSTAELTVTDAAMRFGFTHLGRFSGHYRTMFAELPSRTLMS